MARGATASERAAENFILNFVCGLKINVISCWME